MAQRLHPRGRARPTERSRPRGSKRARRDAPSGAGCLRAWAEENDGLVSGWRASRSSGPGRAAQQAARRCRLAFDSLLRKIQGLPAALPSLSLELTVLYNSLLFAVSESDGLVEGEAERISHGLIRVLEACGVSGQDLSTEELWQKVLQDVTMEELCVPLHRLGALQGAVWLAANCLGSVTGLFRLLSDTKGLEPSAPQEENELLALLQSWSVPVEEDTSPLVVQSTKELKETLWTSAAFLQGLQGLEAGNLPAALSLLQAAATGFCSKRILAQIYTCIGCCSQRMGKPQTALQHLKRAVQVDSQCLSALSHAASLYHQLGETDAELEALTLLYKEAVYIDPCMLIRTELLVHTPALASLFSRCHPSEVKYQLAQRCLQAGRVGEAVEHYLDLLALLQEGLQHQVPLHGRSALPRIPEVFLEAASALEQLERYRDAIAVCEEIITRTDDLIPETLRIELNSSTGGDTPGRAGSPSLGIPPQQRESLRCIVWRAAAYLHQGQARSRLGESKEAITQFTRCLHVLLRVQLVSAASIQSSEETPADALPEAKVLQKIRLLALLGRGSQFQELGRDKEALMNFQHGLQVCPGDPAATSHLLQVLWKLNRRQEAAALWQKLHAGAAPADSQQEAPGRPYPLYLASCLQHVNVPCDEAVVKNMQDYLRTSGQDQ
ncbi:Fanconi anemia group G protein isoform X2 [Carettochelys insculpta]|uniref:Fanconi anemia group G protein isoform X2 n=1 Tax=Carettochelys insculpta TaxID=44489 RepID=UPI003EB85403